MRMNLHDDNAQRANMVQPSRFRQYAGINVHDMLECNYHYPLPVIKLQSPVLRPAAFDDGPAAVLAGGLASAFFFLILLIDLGIDTVLLLTSSFPPFWGDDG